MDQPIDLVPCCINLAGLPSIEVILYLSDRTIDTESRLQSYYYQDEATLEVLDSIFIGEVPLRSYIEMHGWYSGNNMRCHAICDQIECEGSASDYTRPPKHALDRWKYGEWIS